MTSVIPGTKCGQLCVPGCSLLEAAARNADMPQSKVPHCSLLTSASTSGEVAQGFAGRVIERVI